jgi:arginine N-succinyltransferase
MMVIRPARDRDLNGIYKLAAVAGEGLTTLPLSRERLAARIQRSQRSFAADVKKPDGEYYFLILENLETREIVGTTGVFAAVGIKRPFYNSTLRVERHASPDPEVQSEARVLHMGTPYKGCAELATLFLREDCRHGGNGSLLSKSRHLLLAAHPGRFAPKAMAEIRGWVDGAGRSPFWDAVCRPFFNMDLVIADRINSMGNWQFIRDLYPRKPVYIDLLPKEAQSVIAIPHPESAGALRLLESEGFAFKKVIDIFDGGPCVEARVADIRAAKESRTAEVSTAKNGNAGGRYLVTNPSLDAFRAVLCPVENKGKNAIGVPAEALKALQLKAGDDARFVSLKPEAKT